MLENRRHFRVRELLKVHWSIEGQKEKGEGIALNVSMSGMQLLTDTLFKPSDNCVIAIEAPADGSLPFSPKKATLTRFSRLKRRDGGVGYMCGLKFTRDCAFDQKLKDWVDGKVSRMSNAVDPAILSNYMF